jgi:GntR family transcriptional regulator/MocR family aminotransferase
VHSVDSSERTIFVGTFANILFPSLRVGYMVIPEALRTRVMATRLLAEQHTPNSVQAIVADFVEEGHFSRHLRRVREAVSDRYSALMHSLNAHCGAELDPCPASAGVHVMCGLPLGASEQPIVAEAARRGVVVQPLRMFRYGDGRPGLVLGFGRWTPEELDAGVKRLARALSSVRQAGVVAAHRDARVVV